MSDDRAALPRRRSRLGLFAPFILLGLVVAGWMAAWFVIRDRTSHALDGWIAHEARLGRQWACANRAVGGFPFRIEVTCDSLSLERPDSRLTVGAVRSVAQVYQPRHLITHIAGPLRASDGPVAVDGNWRLLQASIRASEGGLELASLVVDGPEVRVSGLLAGDLDLSGERIETHLRPNPTRVASEGAYDWSLRGSRLVIPGLDGLVGGAEPADLDLQLTATQARDVTARPLPEELERWRRAGGQLEIARMALAKGGRRIEGKGEVGLDEIHRPQGRAELAAVGLEGLLGTITGERNRATAALLGALIGRSAPPDAPPPGAAGGPALKPLPPLSLEGGRIRLGPLALPGIRVPPLY